MRARQKKSPLSGKKVKKNTKELIKRQLSTRKNRLLEEVVEESVLVDAQNGPDTIGRGCLDGGDDSGSAHSHDADSDGQTHQDSFNGTVAELEDLAALVDVRERNIGDRDVEELAQRLPALLQAKVEQVLLGDGGAHLGIVGGVQLAESALGGLAGAGAEPAGVDVADANDKGEADPGGELVADEVVEAVEPGIGEDAVALRPLVKLALDEDHLGLGVGAVDFLAKVGGDVGDGAVRADEPVPVAAGPRQHGVVGRDVERPEPAVLAQVGEVAPRGAAPGVQLRPVVELHDVVDGRDA